jgi:hypothetical protein
VCNGDGTKPSVLNQIIFNFFVKTIRTKGFRNPNNESKYQIGSFINFFKKIESRPKVTFEINNWKSLVNSTNPN